MPRSNITPRPCDGFSAVKQVTETQNNQDVLQEDNELFVSLPGGRSFGIDLLLIVTSPAAQDIDVQLAWQGIGATGYTAGHNYSLNFNDTALGTEFTIATNAAAVQIFRFWGYITTTASGRLVLNWAQHVAAAVDTKVFAGSYLRVTSG